MPPVQQSTQYHTLRTALAHRARMRCALTQQILKNRLQRTHSHRQVAEKESRQTQCQQILRRRSWCCHSAHCDCSNQCAALHSRSLRGFAGKDPLQPPQQVRCQTQSCRQGGRCTQTLCDVCGLQRVQEQNRLQAHPTDLLAPVQRRCGHTPSCSASNLVSTRLKVTARSCRASTKRRGSLCWESRPQNLPSS
jgi:hypothetical protein